jgi:hypothetical protein
MACVRAATFASLIACASAKPRPASEYVLFSGPLTGADQSRLVRGFDRAEINYFGSLLGHVIEVVNKTRERAALPPCAPVRDEEHASPQLAQPDSLVPGRTMLASNKSGRVPASWNVTVTCPRSAAKPIALRIELENRWSRQRPPGTVVSRQRRPGVREAWLGVERPGADEGWRLKSDQRTGRPGFAALHASVSDETDDATSLLRSLSLDELVSAISAPPPPTRAPSKRADAPARTEREQERRAARVEVYVSFLDQQFPGLHGRYVAERTSRFVTIDQSFFARLPADVLPSAFEDNSHENEREGELPTELSGAVFIQMLSKQDVKSVFAPDGNAPRGWGIFWQRYGPALISLSQVGLSNDSRQAVVLCSWGSDSEAGGGDLFVLERTEEGWRILYRMHLWSI